ncbi:hypothetical protein N665_0080s0009, partial [Sinapis alba]
MSAKKKKSRPPFAVSSRASKFLGSVRASSLAKSKSASFSSIGISVSDVVASKSLGPLISSVPPISPSVGSGISPASVAGVRPPSPSSAAGLPKDPVAEPLPSMRNYASLLKSSADLKELGIPAEHTSGVPFVLIPDENIAAAKQEFKDYLFARFHSDVPPMGRIIGVLNAVWAKSGPRIYVHNIEKLSSRSCWNIAGVPMFVSSWSPGFTPPEAPVTSSVVPVEMRNVPYLLFNNESLSRLATAVGKPVSVAPETQRKQNFKVAKLYVKVDLMKRLPDTIVSGFSNGKEVLIDVSYPWLPLKCDNCGKYGHKKEDCRVGVPVTASGSSVSAPRRDVPSVSPPNKSDSTTNRSTSVKQKERDPTMGGLVTSVAGIVGSDEAPPIAEEDVILGSCSLDTIQDQFVIDGTTEKRNSQDKIAMVSTSPVDLHITAPTEVSELM